MDEPDPPIDLPIEMDTTEDVPLPRSSPPVPVPMEDIQAVSDVTREADKTNKHEWAHGDKQFVIAVPAPVNREEYIRYPEEFTVAEVIAKQTRGSEIYYAARFKDGSRRVLSHARVSSYENGESAILQYEVAHLGDSEDELAAVQTSIKRKWTTANNGSRRVVDDDEESEDGGGEGGIAEARRRLFKRQTKISDFVSDDIAPEAGEDEPVQRNGRPVRSTRSKGQTEFVQLPADFDTDDEDGNSGSVDRRRSGRSIKKKKYTFDDFGWSDFEEEENTRRSERKVQKKNYADAFTWDDEFIEEYQIEPPKPIKKPKTKEIWPTYDDNDEFVKYHSEYCQTCYEGKDNDNKGKSFLIYCQGCSYSYHPACIGSGRQRNHTVTVLPDGVSVLQCSLCVNKRREKDSLAPLFDMCAGCKVPGPACKPFDHVGKKINKDARPDTSGEEDKRDRYEVDDKLINNRENVLFRCGSCKRGYHFHHLPPPFPDEEETDLSMEDCDIADRRLGEYTNDSFPHWHCYDCRGMDSDNKISAIVAWRPIDEYKEETLLDSVPEHKREYLVRYKNLSYHPKNLDWKSGYWTYNMLATKMRRAFYEKELPPCQNKEDAVPPEYIQVELILDIKETQVGLDMEPAETFEEAMGRIDEVESAFVKFLGLHFEDVVWIEPPKKDEPFYEDFRMAFANYIRGFFVKPVLNITEKVNEARKQAAEFEEKLELKEQPLWIKGGKLMGYQLEGVNWLYRKWVEGQNCLLSDEMGLGKTIQIISFLSILQMRHELWPFLVIVPMSTIPNWRREILKWCPDMRVVTYSGGSVGRELIKQYDMFDDNGKLKAHVVISEYGTVRDDPTLRKIKWQCLVADEAQRLKNDESQTTKALDGIRAEHRVLMTGTPLQNNIRELLNLLQFVDSKKFNAQKMEEEEYAEVTPEKVKALREILKQYQKRRTKAQVLGFLPPVIDVIVPLTMTVLQRQLYKSILEKDAHLIKSVLFNKSKTAQRSAKDRIANLNSILTRLRQTLCHPYIFNKSLEETDVTPDQRHQNLVDASAKFKFLVQLLPKLQARGHRVLLFTQFLDMLAHTGDLLTHLGYKWAWIDGSVSSIERQKRIDAFNAPDSDMFAFILSTRAGGVGINLATADTVIILDPDFNPHQDMQALARAHRIGQKKPVRVFFLMTKNTAEEKIMERGKKKLSLDHVIIEMNDEDADDEGIDSILKYGARALFEEEEFEEIKYDGKTIDDLLEKTAEEPMQDGKDETGFKYARVWSRDNKFEELVEKEEEAPMSEDMWTKILREREEAARKEEEARQKALGRGQRHLNKRMSYAPALPNFSSDGPAPDEDGESEFEGGGQASDSEPDEVDYEPMILDEPALEPELPRAPIVPPAGDARKVKKARTSTVPQVTNPSTLPPAQLVQTVQQPHQAHPTPGNAPAPFSDGRGRPFQAAPKISAKRMSLMEQAVAQANPQRFHAPSAPVGMSTPATLRPNTVNGPSAPQNLTVYTGGFNPFTPGTGIQTGQVGSYMGNHTLAPNRAPMGTVNPSQVFQQHALQRASSTFLGNTFQTQEQQGQFFMDSTTGASNFMHPRTNNWVNNQLQSSMANNIPAHLMSPIHRPMGVPLTSASIPDNSTQGGSMQAVSGSGQPFNMSDFVNDEEMKPQASGSSTTMAVNRPGASAAGLTTSAATGVAKSSAPIVIEDEDKEPTQLAPAGSTVVPPGTLFHGYSPKNTPIVRCIACDKEHSQGYCPLKTTTFEKCPLCNVAHIYGTECKMFQTVDSCKLLLGLVRQSNEHEDHIARARRYLYGRIGSLNKEGKRKQTDSSATSKRPHQPRTMPTDNAGNPPQTQHPFSGPAADYAAGGKSEVQLALERLGPNEALEISPFHDIWGNLIIGVDTSEAFGSGMPVVKPQIGIPSASSTPSASSSVSIPKKTPQKPKPSRPIGGLLAQAVNAHDPKMNTAGPSSSPKNHGAVDLTEDE